MAIDSSRTVTDKTLLAGQHDDRLAAVPSVTGQFRRVEPTGTKNALGETVYREHPEPWRYTLTVTDAGLIIDRQRFAMKRLIREAFAENGTPITDEKATTLANGLMNRGVSFDSARADSWEDLEKRRRAGEVFPLSIDVTEGKQRMVDAGIPTK